MIRVWYFIIFIFTCCLVSVQAETKVALELIDTYYFSEVSEPSGLTYNPVNNTLFVVGDEGHIAELSLEGDVIKSIYPGNIDLEGIALDPNESILYILDEKGNQILRMSAPALQFIDVINLPKQLKGPFEGLCLYNDQIVLVNQVRKNQSEKASVFFISQVSAELLNKIKTGIVDQSAILIQNEKMYILSDTLNKLYCYDLEGNKIWDTHIPGSNQEGLAIDSEGFYYIAQDHGGVMKLKRREY